MQIEHLKITGMTCGGCASKVNNALEAIGGVGEVSVSLPSNEATVQFDETKTSPEKLALAIVAAGYGVDATHASHPQPVKRGCC